MLIFEFERKLSLSELLFKLLQGQPKFARILLDFLISVDLLLGPLGQHVQNLVAWVPSTLHLMRLNQVGFNILKLLLELIIKRLITIDFTLSLLKFLMDRFLKRCHPRLIFL